MSTDVDLKPFRQLQYLVECRPRGIGTLYDVWQTVRVDTVEHFVHQFFTQPSCQTVWSRRHAGAGIYLHQKTKLIKSERYNEEQHDQLLGIQQVFVWRDLEFIHWNEKDCFET